MLVAHAVTKTFGGIRAVEGVTFEVRRGEVLALLGTNGAGKSTILRAVAGLGTPSSIETDGSSSSAMLPLPVPVVMLSGVALRPPS